MYEFALEFYQENIVEEILLFLFVSLYIATTLILVWITKKKSSKK